MKTINFAELENMVSYNDYTSFVYDNGTQKMESEGEINEDTMNPFEQAENIEMYDMDELPSVKEMMAENMLETFKPAENVSDEGYEEMVAKFAKGNGKIAKSESNGEIVYMLVW